MIEDAIIGGVLISRLTYIRFLETALVALLFLVFNYVIRKLLEKLMDGIFVSSHKRVYRLSLVEHYGKPLHHITPFVLFVLSFFLVLGIWGLGEVIQTALYGAGIAALVIGFASQSILSDFVAGVLILMDQPFKIGEWIQVGPVEGIVSDITIKSTRIRSFDNEYVTLPNSKVSVETVINRTR